MVKTKQESENDYNDKFNGKKKNEDIKKVLKNINNRQIKSKKLS